MTVVKINPSDNKNFTVSLGQSSGSSKMGAMSALAETSSSKAALLLFCSPEAKLGLLHL